MTPVTTDRDDAELLRAARRGDDRAARTLLDRHLPAVVAVCRNRLRDPADVDDAVQETLERTLRRLAQLRDPASLGPWVRTIAARVCVDMHRRAAREQAQGRAPDVTDTWRAEPDVVVLIDEEARAVHNRLETLDERDRLALWWRDALGVPVDEIAAELSLTNGATRAVLTRARRRFRESYRSVGVGIGALTVSVRDRLQRVGVRGGATAPWEVAGQVVAASAVAAVLFVAPGGSVPDTPQDTTPTPAAATTAVEHPDRDDDPAPTTPSTPSTPAVTTPSPTAPAAASPADTPDEDAEAPRGALTVTRQTPAEEPVADVRDPDSGVGAEVYAGELHGATDELAEEIAEVVDDASTVLPGLR